MNVLIPHVIICVFGIFIKHTKQIFSKLDIFLTISAPLYTVFFILKDCTKKEMIYCLSFWLLSFIHLIQLCLERPTLSKKYFDYHDLGHCYISISFLLIISVTKIKLVRFSLNKF
jgi:hypothetical protein